MGSTRLYFHDGTFWEVSDEPVDRDEAWPAHLAHCAILIAEEQERLIAAIHGYKNPAKDDETTSICREILFWLKEYERHRGAVLKRLEAFPA